jgi:WD40 repeat protein
LAAGLEDGGIQVWDTRDGTLKQSLMQEGRAFDVTFSKDGKTLLSHEIPKNNKGIEALRLWDLATGQSHRVTIGVNERYLEPSPDGRLLATGAT